MELCLCHGLWLISEGFKVRNLFQNIFLLKKQVKYLYLSFFFFFLSFLVYDLLFPKKTNSGVPPSTESLECCRANLRRKSESWWFCLCTLASETQPPPQINMFERWNNLFYERHSCWKLFRRFNDEKFTARHFCWEAGLWEYRVGRTVLSGRQRKERKGEMDWLDVVMDQMGGLVATCRMIVIVEI